jgi:hypothetical protein
VSSNRIERTLFMLDWLLEPELRRRVTAILNKGELRNTLSPCRVPRNRLGEIRDRTFQAHRHRASGLNLVTAAIILWNTVYLEKATAALRKRGRPFDEAWLQHIAGALEPHQFDRRLFLEGRASTAQSAEGFSLLYFPFRQVTPTSAANRAQLSPACCARHASDGLNARGRRA